MPTPLLTQNNRGKQPCGNPPTNPPTDTAKQNRSAMKVASNEKGSIWIGGIDKQGTTTQSVSLQSVDGEHQLSLDIDGPREGCTTSTSPGRFTVECGSNMKEAEESCAIEAKNGNISITASNGKIRLQATDIELCTVGEGGRKGNITLNSGENIIINAEKKFTVSASSYIKLCSAGDFECAANSVLSMYGSLFINITDSVRGKPAKNGSGQRELAKNGLPSASPSDVASLDRGAAAAQYAPGTSNVIAGGY